jgi:hypothetical protein
MTTETISPRTITGWPDARGVAKIAIKSAHNLWSTLPGLNNGDSLLTYEGLIRHDFPTGAEEILAHTDAEYVKRFDAIVTRINECKTAPGSREEKIKLLESLIAELIVIASRNWAPR